MTRPLLAYDKETYAITGNRTRDMPQSDAEIILKFLIDQLDPSAKDELQKLLGGGELPDLGQDGLHGRIGMDRLPERIKRRAIAGLNQDRKAADAKAFAERYPDAMKVKA